MKTYNKRTKILKRGILFICLSLLLVGGFFVSRIVFKKTSFAQETKSYSYINQDYGITITSDKYIINQENKIIFVGNETDPTNIINNLNVQGGSVDIAKSSTNSPIYYLNIRNTEKKTTPQVDGEDYLQETDENVIIDRMLIINILNNKGEKLTDDNINNGFVYTGFEEMDISKLVAVVGTAPAIGTQYGPNLLKDYNYSFDEESKYWHRDIGYGPEWMLEPNPNEGYLGDNHTLTTYRDKYEVQINPTHTSILKFILTDREDGKEPTTLVSGEEYEYSVQLYNRLTKGYAKINVEDMTVDCPVSEDCYKDAILKITEPYEGWRGAKVTFTAGDWEYDAGYPQLRVYVLGSTDEYDDWEGQIWVDYVGLRRMYKSLPSLSGTATIENNNNKLQVLYNGNTIKSYPIVSLKNNNSKYKVTNDYIYTGLEPFNPNDITITNGTKEYDEDSKMLIIKGMNENNELVEISRIPVITVSSTKYNRDLEKGYINSGYQFNIDDITATNANKNIVNDTTYTNIPNKLEIKFGETVLESYKIISITSTKYSKIDLEKDTIYVKNDTFNLDDIIVVNASKSYDSNTNTLTISDYNNNELKTYKVVSFKSSKYDLSKDYIYIGTNNFENDIITINCKVVYDDVNSKLYIKSIDEKDTIEKYDVIKLSSTKYDLTKDYVYAGINNLDTDDIKVKHGEKAYIDGKLYITYNGEKIDSYEVIKLTSTSESYKFIDDEEIYTNTIDFDLNKLSIENGELRYENDIVYIDYTKDNNKVLVKSYPVIKVTSLYDLTKGYIYLGTDSYDETKISVTNGKALYENNEVKIIDYRHNTLDTYKVQSIDFGNLVINDKTIAIEKGTTYNDIANEITIINGTFKIFKNTTQVLNGTLEEGMMLKIYDKEKNEIIDANYTIRAEYFEIEGANIKNGLITNLAKSTTIENLISKISTNGTYKIYDNKKNEILDNSQILTTGVKITVTQNNISKDYYIVIKGDITGNGKIKMADVMKISKYLKDNSILTAPYIKAADYDNNGIVDINDAKSIAEDIVKGWK